MAIKKPSAMGSVVIKAIQGNFDHLMGVVRNIAEAHNATVDGIEEMEGTLTLVHSLIEGTVNDVSGHTAGTSGNHALPDMSDVANTASSAAADGDVLTWDDGNQRWDSAAATGGAGGSDIFSFFGGF